MGADKSSDAEGAKKRKQMTLDERARARMSACQSTPAEAVSERARDALHAEIEHELEWARRNMRRVLSKRCRSK